MSVVKEVTTTSSSLHAGTLYELIASGGFVYHEGEPDILDEWEFDAKYERFNSHRYRNPYGLLVNGNSVDWWGTADGRKYSDNTFSPNSNYRHFVYGNGTPATFDFRMSNGGIPDGAWGGELLQVRVRAPFGEPESNPINDTIKQIQPIQRLGKWDGDEFVAVSSDSITSGNVHVISHGWAPGMKSWVDNHPDDLPLIWDRDASNSASGWLEGTAKEIANRDPSAVVLAYSWIDDSASDGLAWPPLEAKTSRDNAVDHGSTLSTALKDAFSPGSDPSLHLLGHSHGAAVSTHAAIALESSNVQVDHLTLLDSPEFSIAGLWGGGINSLGSYLPDLSIGTGENETFVDNYISMVGSKYYIPGVDDGLVNIQLLFDGNNADPAKHDYAVHWYDEANQSPSFGVGLNWSPLLGDEYKSLTDQYYLQDWIVRFDSATGQYIYDEDMELVLKSKSGVYNPPTMAAMQSQEVATDGSVISYENGDLYTENSPAAKYSVFQIEPHCSTLEFDYEFLSLGDGDELGIWIDGERLFKATGSIVGTGRRKGVIDVQGLSVGEHYLTVALHSYGDANASFYVGDFTLGIVIPEPTSMVLAIFASVLIACRSRKAKCS